jgi:hypothetical protein
MPTVTIAEAVKSAEIFKVLANVFKGQHPAVLEFQGSGSTAGGPLHFLAVVLTYTKVPKEYRADLVEALVESAEEHTLGAHEDFARAIAAVSQDKDFQDGLKFVDSLGQDVLYIELIREAGELLVSRLREKCKQ